MISLSDNYHRVQDEVASAAARAGRSAEDITLIAVSKGVTAQQIRALADLGQRNFGENYVQEALPKTTSLADLDLHWHFIGKLQQNKARFLVNSRFSSVQSLDSYALAREINRRAQLDQCCLRILVQVNIGAETQKNGIDSEELPELLQRLPACSALSIDGLMAIPPLGSPAQTLPYFQRLSELSVSLRAQGLPLGPELSMGMSQDYREAIGAGATMVRIGTAIFGPRPGIL